MKKINDYRECTNNRDNQVKTTFEKLSKKVKEITK